MKKNPYCKITKQGAPVINSCICVFNTKNARLFELDLKSKYCEIACVCSDDNGTIEIEIEAIAGQSLHLHKSKEGSTIVMFKNLKNYHVFASDLSRYSARICFYNYNYNYKE